jgi:hypothetical protein
MAFPGKQYAPPGVYTQTQFDNPLSSALDTIKIPVIVGEGNEDLVQGDLEIVRGSSATSDQRVVDEDAVGRAVAAISRTGVVTLSDFDGVLDKIQVRNFPITTGDGNGTTTNNRMDVLVTVNGTPVVVRSVTGSNGVIQLAQAPVRGDVVRVTYYFDRTDTLMTDELSAQVDPLKAEIYGNGGLFPGETLNLHADILVNGIVAIPANNSLKVRVDGTIRTIVIAPRTDYTMVDVAGAITAAGAGTLTARADQINTAAWVLVLSADSSLEILDGSANAPLFLTTGTADNRTSTFYVFNRPIVDGTGGGITTTDPAHVTVKVNGRQVIPISVDGSTGAVTLATSPAPGATVTVSYYWNTWQDTFDYLAHIGVQRVVRCGTVPGGSDFVQDADFVLESDKIMWGTAAAVEAGATTVGAVRFGDSQVSLSLVDSRNFLGACAPFVRSSGGIATESRTEFVLPFQPTLGNGRDTPIGQSLHQTVSNGRLDLPVNRPDVIWAYWGFDEQDALQRGRVDVTKVDGLVITLATEVPFGARVFATNYYNSIQDQTYTVAAKSAGASGAGTYEVSTPQGDLLYSAKMSGKGSSLSTVSVEFPSGSEFTPDFRFESGSGNDFTGPLADEVVTVTFASRPAGVARFTFPGAAPYFLIPDVSDHFAFLVAGSTVPSFGSGLNTLLPAAINTNWGLAHLVGNEVVYTGGSGATVGQSFTTTADEQFDIKVDGADITVTIPPMTNKSVDFIAQHINEAASGHQSTVPAPVAASVAVPLSITLASPVTDFYVGAVLVLGYDLANPASTTGEFNVIAYNATTQTVTLDAPVTVALGHPYRVYHPTALSKLASATRFDGPVIISATEFDTLKLHYTGSTTGLSGSLTVTLTPGTYATPALLAAHVEAQIASSIATLVAAPGSEKFTGLKIACAANTEGNLEFKLQLSGQDESGYLKFLSGVTDDVDFAVLAGLAADTAVTSAQAALVHGPIARAYQCPPSLGNPKPLDRVILRSRVLPPAAFGLQASVYWAEQSRIDIITSYEKGGLLAGTYATCKSPVVVPANISLSVSFQNGQMASGWPSVTLYDGTGTRPANNVLQLNLSGVPVTVELVASGLGTQTAFGPIGTVGTVATQIDAAILAALTLAGQATSYVATMPSASKLDIMSLGKGALDSRLTVGTASANRILGLSTGTRYPTPVAAEDLVSAFMSNAQMALSVWLLSPTAFSSGSFAQMALAAVFQDSAAAKHLYIQHAPTILANLGTASSIALEDYTQSALVYGTNLLASAGDGDVGDAGINGFFVTSSNPTGSGSVNTSILNNGVGQDGIIGQTYRDEVTGLTFTVLPREFTTDPTGPWQAYPVGANSNFRITVSQTFVCDANLPLMAFPGVEMRVSNTLGVEQGDTALAKTFKRSGNEPAIGDLYYATYVYSKQDFATGFFTKMSSVENAFGPAIPDNPVSLATYLAMINGAVLVGIKQVIKEPGSNLASLEAYRTAIEELEGVQAGGATPDITLLMRGDSIDLFQLLKKSNDKMSSLRYKSERTSILGTTAGTLPRDVMNWAPALGNTRERMVYPDMATLTVQDNFGNSKEYLVDGTYIAAALAGSVVSPNVDVATPWTGRRLVGFTQLARKLDSVLMNQIASKGVTIMEDKAPFLRVRHGLTTDMSNILTKLPTIIQISDEVQRQARNTLDGFIGIKFLPGILSQIEGRLAMMLKQLVATQILTAYTGVKANVSGDDPTTAAVEAYYSPVFPLLYLLVNFHLRSSL